ncbi:VCBS repeat-containing protein, partial [bacterium]|nr:VCBS repeat-containing protein [candidate division CSSED10-310 bacterium]
MKPAGSLFLVLMCAAVSHAAIDMESVPVVQITGTQSVDDLAWGDFDGDGDLDLAVAAYGSTDKVLRNDDLSFSSQWAAGLSATYTSAVAVGDLDRNGEFDLVCATMFDRNTVYWQDNGQLCNVGSGECWQSTQMNDSYGVAVGDIDDDGFLDLVFANSLVPNQFCCAYLFHQDLMDYPATPDWVATQPWSARAVALADFNADGYLDLAVGCSAQQDLVFFSFAGTLGSSPGWYSNPATDTRDIAVGDYDGDGDMDLVCANFQGGNTLYRNFGYGLEYDPYWTSSPATSTLSVDMGDADGDGDLDLAFADAEGTCSVYECDVNGDFEPFPDWQVSVTGASAVAWGDCDGDRDLDLAVGTTANLILVYRNRSGILSKYPKWVSTPSLQTVGGAVFDLELDGDLDVMVGNANQGLSLYRCGESGLDITPAWRSSEDFDHPVLALDKGLTQQDTHVDVAVGTDAGVFIFDNDSGVFSDMPVLGGSGVFQCNDLRWWDFNLDSYMDIVATDGNGPIRLFANYPGQFSLTQPWTSSSTMAGRGLAVADMDGDGFDEFCVALEDGAPGSAVLFDNERGYFDTAPGWISAGTAGALSAAFIDVGGAGFPSLAVGLSTGGVLLHENDGGELDEEPAWQAGQAAPAWDLLSWDVNQDGIIDLAVAYGGAPNELFLGSAGGLPEEPSWRSATVFDSRALLPCDPDDDGDVDLFETNYGSVNALYENRSAPAPLLPEVEPWMTMTVPVRLVTEPVEIPYVLYGDPLVTYGLQVEFSPGNGVWHPATSNGGHGTSGLAASLAGESHVFRWDIRADHLYAESEAVVVRFKPRPESIRVAHWQYGRRYFYSPPFRCHAKPMMRILYPRWNGADNEELLIQYILNRQCYSLQMRFTRYAGPPDPYSPHVLSGVLTGNSGINAVLVDGLDLNGNGPGPEDALVDGVEYEVRLSGVDVHGLPGSRLVCHWVFDVSPPVTSIEYPSHDSHIAGYPVSIDGTCEDGFNGAGLTEVHASIDDQELPVSGLAEWTATWYPVADGRYVLRAWGEDVAGNREEP